MNKKAAISILIIHIIFLAPSYRGNAIPAFLKRIGQVAELTGGETNQVLSYSVSISGDTITVGDIFDNQDGAEAGSVTIFQAVAEPPADGYEIFRLQLIDQTNYSFPIYFGDTLGETS
jgi:hypothetical protein